MGKRETIEELSSGDIGACIGLKDSKTGDTLCSRENPILLESIEFPKPVISMSIEPERTQDLDKFNESLVVLQDEDPTLQVSTDHETKQTIISGMGELHLDIIVDRMKREFGVV